MTKPMPLEGVSCSDRNVVQAVNFGIVNCLPSPELLKQMRDEIGSGTASPYLTPLELVDGSKLPAEHGTGGGAHESHIFGGRGISVGEHVGSSSDRMKLPEHKTMLEEKIKGQKPFENMTRDENVQHATRALLERWAAFKRDTRWIQDPDMKLHRTGLTPQNEGAAMNS